MSINDGCRCERFFVRICVCAVRCNVMKFCKLPFVCLILYISTLGFPLFPAIAQGEPERPTHVIVISLDGTRPDAILKAETPNLQALAERGATDWEAVTVLP